jgi:hypothetical protein
MTVCLWADCAVAAKRKTKVAIAPVTDLTASRMGLVLVMFSATIADFSAIEKGYRRLILPRLEGNVSP